MEKIELTAASYIPPTGHPGRNGTVSFRARDGAEPTEAL